jgi:predicted nucleic acid-binding protein
MRLVVDTSVLIAVIANEREKPALIRATQGADLLAPSSCHWEIGKAFSAMLKRKRITLAQAQQAIDVYLQIPIRFFAIDLGQAVALADQLGIYAYDAYLIGCARDQHCDLLTLDRGLRYAAEQVGVHVVEVDS